MLNKFSQYFEKFKLRENIDTRLTVFEFKYSRFTRSLKIEVWISNSGLADKFKIGMNNLSPSLKKNVEIHVLPEKRIFGLVNVSPASVFDSPDYKSSLLTQTLLGEKLDILQKKDGWLRIKCEDGYIGWLNSSQVVLSNKKEISIWQSKKFLTCRSIIGDIREKPDEFSIVLSKITVGTKLPYLKKNGKWIKVILPDTTNGWIRERNEFTWLDDNEKSFSDRIVLTSQNFLGIPYLWGGKSPMGFDCSGFVQAVFSLNGVSLPRDSDMQYEFANSPLRNMKRGDLLFFGKDKVSHVGIYIGRKRFIHSKGFVKINSFDKNDKYYDKYLKQIFIEHKTVC